MSQVDSPVIFSRNIGSSRIRVGAFPSSFGPSLMNNPQNHRVKQPLGIWKTRADTRGFQAFKADFKIPVSKADRLEVRTRPQAENAQGLNSDSGAAS